MKSIGLLGALFACFCLWLLTSPEFRSKKEDIGGMSEISRHGVQVKTASTRRAGESESRRGESDTALAIDYADLFRKASNIEDRNERKSALGSLFHKLGVENNLVGLELLKEIDPGSLKNQLIEDFCSQITDLSFLSELLGFGESLAFEDEQKVFLNSLRRLIGQIPYDSLEQISQTTQGPIGESLKRSLGSKLALKKNTTSEISKALSELDGVTIESYLQYVTDSNRESVYQGIIDESIPEKFRQTLSTKVVGSLARESFKSALDAIPTLPFDEESRFNVTYSVYAGWLISDRVEAVEQIQSLPHSAEQEMGLKSLVRFLDAQGYYDEAKEWQLFMDGKYRK